MGKFVKNSCSNMDQPQRRPKGVIILMLLVPTLTQCFPATAKEKGGNNHMFYCETPGCATNVTRVFCNDNLVFSDANIPQCTGPPSPNAVCQHNGRAFISRNTDGPCEFEGPNGYIETKKCPELSDICDFTNGSAPPPLSTKAQQNDKESHVTEISVGVIFTLLLLMVLGLTAYFCMKKYRSQQQANHSDVTVRLEDTQSSGETRERLTDHDPGLSDGSPASQRVHGS